MCVRPNDLADPMMLLSVVACMLTVPEFVSAGGRRITIPDLLQHPWYQTNLPPGAANMNYNLLQSLVPAGLQSVEQIEETVQQATRVTAWPGWPQS